MLFLTIHQKIMNVCGTGWPQMEFGSSLPCCLQHLTHSGVPYPCFTWLVLVLRAHSWQNPYCTDFLNHCKVLSKNDTHFLLQLKTSPPKSWPRCRWGHMFRGWLELKPTLVFLQLQPTAVAVQGTYGHLLVWIGNDFSKGLSTSSQVTWGC